MNNLQDLINLAKADGGKFFVIDEQGDAKLVIMSVEDYQKLLLGKLQRQIHDVENINKMIIQAQLNEDEAASSVGRSKNYGQNENRDMSAFASRSSQSRGPQVVSKREPVDLRSEVIDPSFDFEGPKLGIDDL